jgi:hypothetical protein
MTITNGTVAYERNVRPADFESKKASVTLSFTVEDGSDPAPVVAKVFAMAVAEVHRRLGIVAPSAQQPSITMPAGTQVSMLSTGGMTAPTETKSRRAKAPPAEVPAENPPATADTASGSGDPADVTTIATPETSTPAATTDDPAAIGDPEVAPEPVVYTDKQLRDAVNYAVGEKKVGNKKIVDLIIEFTNPPGTPEGERVPGKNIPMIEQDRRGGFLDRLKALYADA